MGEWLAKIGASWGAACALGVALLLAAGGTRRLMRSVKRKRVNREGLHIEEFRRTIDALLVELESAATAIESRISSQLERLSEAERSIDDKLRRFELISVSSRRDDPEFPDRADSADVAAAENRTSHISVASEVRVANAPGPAESKRERVSRRPGKFSKAGFDAGQSARLSKIQQMAEDGSSPAAIAECLHLPLGEVETYLSLRQFAQSARGEAVLPER